MNTGKEEKKLYYCCLHEWFLEEKQVKERGCMAHPYKPDGGYSICPHLERMSYMDWFNMKEYNRG